MVMYDYVRSCMAMVIYWYEVYMVRYDQVWSQSFETKEYNIITASPPMCPPMAKSVQLTLQL